MNPNQFDISKFIQPFNYGGQRGETGSFLDRYTLAVPRIQETYARQAGLPQMRENYLGGLQAAQGLQTSIIGMPETVKGTTQDSMVTEAQRSSLVASKQEPLSRNLAQIGSSTALLGEQMGLAEKGVAAKTAAALLPFEMEYDSMQKQQAREFSGYTNENQLELNRLIENMKAGVTLTNAERQRMNDLAMAEKGYQNELDKQRLTNQGQIDLARSPDYKQWFADLKKLAGSL